jgi:hypothetical protein
MDLQRALSTCIFTLGRLLNRPLKKVMPVIPCPPVLPYRFPPLCKLIPPLNPLSTTGRPERFFTKLEHSKPNKSTLFENITLAMRCRWCFLRNNFKLCVFD